MSGKSDRRVSKIAVGKGVFPPRLIMFYRKKFMQWVKENYNPEFIYYPGSGPDKLPKNIFGEKRVVHISLEENKDTVAGGYFRMLGNGLKIQADMRFSPIRENSFDAIILHDAPLEAVEEAIPDFFRVLKRRGIIMFDFTFIPKYEDLIPALKRLARIFKTIPLPKSLESDLMLYYKPTHDPNVMLLVKENIISIEMRRFLPARGQSFRLFQKI